MQIGYNPKKVTFKKKLYNIGISEHWPEVWSKTPQRKMKIKSDIENS